MEERKYTFYDRYQKVKYANITAEELEVLNIFYNNIIRSKKCLQFYFCIVKRVVNKKIF